MRKFLIIPPVIAVVAAAGLALCAVARFDAHAREMLAAAIACLLASELAIVPLFLTRGASQPAVAQAGLVGSVVHLFGCAALGGVGIMMAQTLHLDAAFVYWLLAMYWITLIVLTIMFVRAVKSAGTSAQATASTTRTGLQS